MRPGLAISEDEADGEEGRQDLTLILGQREIGNGALVGIALTQALLDREEALVVAPQVELSWVIEDGRVLTVGIESDDGVVMTCAVKGRTENLRDRVSDHH